MKSTGFTIDSILASKETDSATHLPPEGTSYDQYGESMLDYNYHYHRYFPYPSPTHSRHHHHHHPHHRPLHFHHSRRSVSPPQTISPETVATFSMNDDMEGDKLSRRPRTSITVCQREFLEQEFQKERYPTLAYIDKLSRKVHLQQYVIKVWFQNRRAKYRKEGHRRKQQQKLSPINDNNNATDDHNSVGCNDEKHDSKENHTTLYTTNRDSTRDNFDYCTNSTHSSKYTKEIPQPFTTTAKSKLYTASEQNFTSTYPWRRVSEIEKSTFFKSKCRCLMCQDKYLL